MKNAILALLSKFLFMLSGPTMKMGSTDVRLCSVQRDRGWIVDQREVIRKTEELLSADVLNEYRTYLCGSIDRLIIADIGMDRYIHNARTIILRHVPKLTDSPLYLASRLIELTVFGDELIDNRADRDTAAQRAKKRQQEFLSVCPGGAHVVY